MGKFQLDTSFLQIEVDGHGEGEGGECFLQSFFFYFFRHGAGAVIANYADRLIEHIDI